MKRLIITTLCFLLLHSLVFAQHETQKDDTFQKYEEQVANYIDDFNSTPSYVSENKRLIDQIREARANNVIFEYIYHSPIKKICDYEFYEFWKFGENSEHHIAMIDNEKSSIAFLDILTFNQTLDSINNVLKGCEQQMSSHEFSIFYEKIKNIYNYDRSRKKFFSELYSSPSQAVVNLLSAEHFLNFEAAKWYIDYETVYKSQEEWEKKVRANPPNIEFYKYWFYVEESRGAATVTTWSDNKRTIYSLKHYWGEWIVVGIEWEDDEWEE